MMATIVKQSGFDPATLSLKDLRELRVQLQKEDDVVSYVRRIAQARLDIVRCYQSKIEVDGDNTTLTVDVADQLRGVLSQSLTAPGARPPRPTEEMELDPIAHELDLICANAGYSRVHELAADELDDLEEQLASFEHLISINRQDRYAILDVVNAELVRRYRDGVASPGD